MFNQNFFIIALVKAEGKTFRFYQRTKLAKEVKFTSKNFELTLHYYNNSLETSIKAIKEISNENTRIIKEVSIESVCVYILLKGLYPYYKKKFFPHGQESASNFINLFKRGKKIYACYKALPLEQSFSLIKRANLLKLNWTLNSRVSSGTKVSLQQIKVEVIEQENINQKLLSLYQYYYQKDYVKDNNIYWWFNGSLNKTKQINFIEQLAMKPNTIFLDADKHNQHELLELAHDFLAKGFKIAVSFSPFIYPSHLSLHKLKEHIIFRKNHYGILNISQQAVVDYIEEQLAFFVNNLKASVIQLSSLSLYPSNSPKEQKTSFSCWQNSLIKILNHSSQTFLTDTKIIANHHPHKFIHKTIEGYGVENQQFLHPIISKLFSPLLSAYLEKLLFHSYLNRQIWDNNNGIIALEDLNKSALEKSLIVSLLVEGNPLHLTTEKNSVIETVRKEDFLPLENLFSDIYSKALQGKISTYKIASTCCLINHNGIILIINNSSKTIKRKIKKEHLKKIIGREFIFFDVNNGAKFMVDELVIKLSPHDFRLFFFE